MVSSGFSIGNPAGMAFAREVLGPNAYKLVKSGKLEMSQRHFYMRFYRFGEVQPVKRRGCGQGHYS
ncbi:MAG TPA: hypothetical protein ACFCUC_17595, partial [Desulfobacterales bacterium]